MAVVYCLQSPPQAQCGRKKSELGSQQRKPRRAERFGKAISQLIMFGNKTHTQLLISHAFPNRSQSQCV